LSELQLFLLMLVLSTQSSWCKLGCQFSLSCAGVRFHRAGDIKEWHIVGSYRIRLGCLCRIRHIYLNSLCLVLVILLTPNNGAIVKSNG